MASATVIYLKDTNHVVSAFTRNGATEGKLEESAFQKLFSGSLPLRHLRQSTLTPQDIAPTPGGTSPTLLATDARLKGTCPKEFVLDVGNLSTLGLPPNSPLLGVISRPSDYSVEKDSVQVIPAAPDAYQLDHLEYEILSDGITVTIVPIGGTATEEEIPVVVVFRIEPQGFFLTQRDSIQENKIVNSPSTVKITFPSIPTSVEHQLLLLIPGFRPIWDILKVKEKRRWNPA